LKEIDLFVVSSVDTIGAFNTGFDSGNLHRRTLRSGGKAQGLAPGGVRSSPTGRSSAVSSAPAGDVMVNTCTGRPSSDVASTSRR
jgi:hypothetical protein